jgi:hypothetical protein
LFLLTGSSRHVGKFIEQAMETPDANAGNPERST